MMSLHLIPVNCQETLGWEPLLLISWARSLSRATVSSTRQELVEMIEDRNSLAKELNLAHERHAKTNASAMEIILQLQAQISQMLPLQQQLHSTQQQLHAVQLANKDQVAESEALKVRIGQIYALAAPKG